LPFAGARPDDPDQSHADPRALQARHLFIKLLRRRYGYAQEWYDVIRKLWTTEERFDWAGKYFNLEQVYTDPKP
jgi:alkanesulfonate monooxygenase SsuD/methylene tetrahydromethanopterin reductase-like flavin-dependent oxidoreductase (luciferase family)